MSAFWLTEELADPPTGPGAVGGTDVVEARRRTLRRARREAVLGRTSSGTPGDADAGGLGVSEVWDEGGLPRDALARQAEKVSRGAIVLGGGIGVEKVGDDRYRVIGGSTHKGALSAVTQAFRLAGGKAQAGTPGGEAAVTDPAVAARVFELDSLIADSLRQQERLRRSMARRARASAVAASRWAAGDSVSSGDYERRRIEDLTAEVASYRRERAALIAGKVEEAIRLESNRARRGDADYRAPTPKPGHGLPALKKPKRPRAPRAASADAQHPRGTGDKGGQWIKKQGGAGAPIRQAVQRGLGVQGRSASERSSLVATIKAFQRRHGIQVDGVVGEQTGLALAGRIRRARATRPGVMSHATARLVRARHQVRGGSARRGRARPSAARRSGGGVLVAGSISGDVAPWLPEDVLSEANLIINFTERLHPRDFRGRFAQKIASVTPRGSAGPDAAVLPDGTRVVAHQHGGFAVHRSGRITRHSSAEEAAGEALDRSARGREPESYGGATRHRDAEAAHAALASPSGGLSVVAVGGGVHVRGLPDTPEARATARMAVEDNGLGRMDPSDLEAHRDDDVQYGEWMRKNPAVVTEARELAGGGHLLTIRVPYQDRGPITWKTVQAVTRERWSGPRVTQIGSDGNTYAAGGSSETFQRYLAEERAQAAGGDQIVSRGHSSSPGAETIDQAQKVSAQDRFHLRAAGQPSGRTRINGGTERTYAVNLERAGRGRVEGDYYRVGRAEGGRTDRVVSRGRGSSAGAETIDQSMRVRQGPTRGLSMDRMSDLQRLHAEDLGRHGWHIQRDGTVHALAGPRRHGRPNLQDSVVVGSVRRRNSKWEVTPVGESALSDRFPSQETAEEALIDYARRRLGQGPRRDERAAAPGGQPQTRTFWSEREMEAALSTRAVRGKMMPGEGYLPPGRTSLHEVRDPDGRTVGFIARERVTTRVPIRSGSPIGRDVKRTSLRVYGPTGRELHQLDAANGMEGARRALVRAYAAAHEHQIKEEGGRVTSSRRRGFGGVQTREHASVGDAARYLGLAPHVRIREEPRDTHGSPALDRMLGTPSQRAEREREQAARPLSERTREIVDAVKAIGREHGASVTEEQPNYPYTGHVRLTFDKAVPAPRGAATIWDVNNRGSATPMQPGGAGASSAYRVEQLRDHSRRERERAKRR